MRTKDGRRSLSGMIGALFVAAAAAVATIVIPVGAASGEGMSPATGGKPRIDYVALGDSHAAGVGVAPYDPASGDCLRSPQAYPALWAKANAATFAFVACSGATTTDVNQQTSALSAQTDLVTVSAGGNDAGFFDVLVACRFGTDQQCDAAVDNGLNVIKNVLPARLAETYGLINAASPKADVVVMGYPYLFELGGCTGDEIAESRRARLNEAADAMADVTASAAAAAGFVFADTRDEFAGHGVCSTDPWIHALREFADESYHPNAGGHVNAYFVALLKETDYPV